MTSRKTPTFYDLPADEAVDLLTRNHVGRLAFSFHDRVDIEPISYVFAGGWLYARTAPGHKLSTVQHHPWVAFEVDEIRNRLAWRSVVVHGTIYFLDGDREADRADYEKALSVLRKAEPHALTPSDPTPQRNAVFRIHANEIVGKAAKP